MIIDPDVQTMAAHFGLDPKLVQAVVQAEGNIVKAIQASLPSVTTRSQALDILCRSAVHAMSDYLTATDAREGFVIFWGKRWAPVGAANDAATNLNQFWPKNVAALWKA